MFANRVCEYDVSKGCARREGVKCECVRKLVWGVRVCLEVLCMKAVWFLILRTQEKSDQRSFILILRLSAFRNNEGTAKGGVWQSRITI